MKNFNYHTQEYPAEYLIEMAKKGSKWAMRELKLNGYGDFSEADHGEAPKTI